MPLEVHHASDCLPGSPGFTWPFPYILEPQRRADMSLWDALLEPLPLGTHNYESHCKSTTLDAHSLAPHKKTFSLNPQLVARGKLYFIWEVKDVMPELLSQNFWEQQSLVWYHQHSGLGQLYNKSAALQGCLSSDLSCIFVSKSLNHPDSYYT